MDFDFSHISPVKTEWISLGVVRWNSDKPVRLQLRHAGDGTPSYVNARANTPMVAGRIPSLERLATLFANHVVVDWENVNDKEGKSVAFTAELCEKLLLALVRDKRGDVMDYIIAFAVDADHFYGPSPDGTDVGKP